MRILIITTNGITAKFASWPERVQARALVQQGHIVQAYTYLGRESWNNQAVETIDGVEVKRLRRYQWFSLDLLKALLKGPRSDVVQLYHLSNQFNFQAILLCKLLGIPTILAPLGVLHDPYLVADRDRPLAQPPAYDQLIQSPFQLGQALLRHFKPKRALKNYLMHAPLRMADGFIALSNHERDELVKLGVKSERIRVIPCSVDANWLEGIQKPEREGEEVQIFYLGQLKYRKGFDLLAQAMPLILEEFPAARFVFATHSPIQREALLKIAREGGVMERISLLDDVSDPQKGALFLGSTLFVCPSRYEGFGIPLIEAMSANCPVVTTDIPVINELVKDRENGLLFKLEDYRDLARAIIELLEDQSLRDTVVRGGFRTVQRYYTHQVVGEMEEVYREVLQNYRKGFSLLKFFGGKKRYSGN